LRVSALKAEGEATFAASTIFFPKVKSFYILAWTDKLAGQKKN